MELISELTSLRIDCVAKEGDLLKFDAQMLFSGLGDTFH